jgi:uncharacterized membrane protein
MYFGFAILGLITGVFVAASGGSYFFGAVGGAVIGMALARITKLEQRVKELEWLGSKPKQEEVPEAESPPAPETPSEKPRWATQEAHEAWADPEPSEADAGAMQDEAAEASPEEPAKPLKTPHGWPEPKQVRLEPSLLERGLKKTGAWFTTGNVPVKIGIIVTFIGVSFLLKYAIDRELIVFPIEFRLLTVAAAGLALVVIGWRLRDKMRVYALSLQGGGVGILFLTIFAAFRLWQLLPAPLAFILLVVLTFCTGALAVLQNSRSLAIFGIVGGFLAPILTSTGQGNHVALFSYYLVLNGAILGISWFRAWRELNLVGFVFTFVIGSFWGYQYYKPELMASTMPFLVLHFLFYNTIAILYALRQPKEHAGIVDGTLVFGTPVITFALQAALVQDTEYGLAISAAAAAVFYALTAVWLFRNKDGYLRLMTESFIALAVAFGTIAIPLALDARWTAAAWALEGAALVWIGTRQGRQLAKFAGVLLILFSGGAFFDHGWRSNADLAILNGNVLGGLLISLSALFASRRLEHVDDTDIESVQKLSHYVLFLWGALWWLGTGFMEVIDRVGTSNESHAFLLFLSLSMTAAAWLGRVREWSLLRRASLAFLPLLLATALLQLVFDEHFLQNLGWLAWPAAWMAQLFLLKVADEHDESIAGAWHFGSLVLLTGMLAMEASWWTDEVASTAWAGAAATAVTGIMAMLVWRFRKQPAWPVPAHPAAYLNASILLVAVQVIVLTLLSVDRPGNPEPLPYLPVLNPFDLAMLFAMLMATLSLSAIRREAGLSQSFADTNYLQPYKLMLAAAFFVMTTTALVRGVHYYAGVPWNGDALFSSVIVQTSLSIYWGLLGFAGMIWGARSKRRPVWLAGTAFMAVVVAKLFLVDLGNTGTVERIVSFIGIGALLLVVGYFAPAPPRQPNDDDAPDEGGARE